MSGRALPARPVVGVLHPGVMGTALGAALKPVAGAVIWAAAGRSHATAKRAEVSDLVGVPDLAELARRSDVVISCCPPSAALDVARAVAAAVGGRSVAPLFVDANAVSPGVVRDIGELLGPGNVVDAAVVGPPARAPGRSVLWLAGSRAEAVRLLFEGSPFTPRVLPGGGLGAASALAACYGLETAGVAALRTAAAAAARRCGVEETLREELARTAGDRAGGASERRAEEMDAAGDALAALGLPDGFARAAAEAYRRLAAGDL
jgi:3-hydroxyisobutyrate dehydrogenase-like beta-hydroxyacid dehydrogenase